MPGRVCGVSERLGSGTRADVTAIGIVQLEIGGSVWRRGVPASAIVWMLELQGIAGRDRDGIAVLLAAVADVSEHALGRIKVLFEGGGGGSLAATALRLKIDITGDHQGYRGRRRGPARNSRRRRRRGSCAGVESAASGSTGVLRAISWPLASSRDSPDRIAVLAGDVQGRWSG